ncbi:MAG: SAM-dependent chlorinase/fluorinase [Deltaproteobacteria bacterium]|nr:SAM-dependent chlorinase/fluorinase [Deltaproteobacteria bacterium]MBW1953698.1 SAM-dependent chlorinase/fluorinase [Deltaproteobacteria bacterium]MBW1987640.1 SAM-dependent chlorinase/fluorinase [Deltaproteobacteria bacterium]MBW2135715.1 SAM-dependent chlorinase/fluorinase [Deltaproteobacteria bacterium]
MDRAGQPQWSLITLLTDFGCQDGYVGIMKGVILGINPQVTLVDLSHDLPPQDVIGAALVLQAAHPYFPPDTIHLAVVDPGVGTARRGLALRVRNQFWVGPDNGLFHLVLEGQPDFRAVGLENPAYFLPQVSATFQGRDVFAPVAAYLSTGVPLDRLGSPVIDPVPLNLPVPEISSRCLRGQVIHVDHFGNLISNIRFSDLENWLQGRPINLQVGNTRITRLVRTYAQVAPGELIALKGSHGYLEIACAQGNAAQLLGGGRQFPIEILA